MTKNSFFFNGCFDKSRIKSLISWSLQNCGEKLTIDLVENLKNIGFVYATQAGVSLGIDDLKIPMTKSKLLLNSDKEIQVTQINYKQGYLTGIEKFQELIDTWHKTSEILKQDVIHNFKITDILNPVYMMAFSGARGNVSQVRQLVGMRGLMSDPQGQILDFPIKSNFREGLTLTEYIISCYGARKGLVDTALKTANSGYLTRRLVDISHHIIVCEFDCETQKGIIINNIIENQKVIVSLQSRLVGRILAENVFSKSNFSNKKTNLFLKEESLFTLNKTYLKKIKNNARIFALFSKCSIIHFFDKDQNWIFKHHIKALNTRGELIGLRNQEISFSLAAKIASLKKNVLVRSPLTCEIKNSICQLCYGWSLADSKLVSLGEAVGILAAQSIGEPGTQLTMRTFHTGGVFSGDIMNEIKAPFDGIIQFSEFFQGMLIRTPHGKIAFLTKVSGECTLYAPQKSDTMFLLNTKNVKPSDKTKDLEKITFKVPALTILFVRNHEYVNKTQIIAEFSSMSANREQRIQANYDLSTEIEGEVHFKNVLVNLLTQKQEVISSTTGNLGSIWILSGKIFKEPIPIEIFPQVGDIVDQTSILGQYQAMSPYNGFITKQSNSTKYKLIKKPTTTKNVLKFNSQIQWKYKNQNNKTPPLNQAKLALFFSPKPISTSKKSLKNKNFEKAQVSNNKFFLNHTFISLIIRSIQYKKIGYFFSLSNFNNSLLTKNTFFLSNSFQFEFQNSNKLKKNFSFQSYLKQYETQTGGIVVYDNFYANEKFYCGEIFWVLEESYIFNPQKSIFFKKKFEKNTKLLNVKSLLTYNSKNKFFKNYKKIINKNNPLILNSNRQGKISNFYSKLYGCVDINTTNFRYSKFFKKTQNNSLLNLNTNYFNNLRPLFSIYKFNITGFKINPICSIFYLLKVNLLFNNKSNNVNTYSLPINKLFLYIFRCVKKNKKINIKLLEKNHLPLLQPQFPWFTSTTLTVSSPLFSSLFLIQIKAFIHFFRFTRDFSKKQQSKKSNTKVNSEKMAILNFDLLTKKLINKKEKKSLFKINNKAGWVYVPKTYKQFIQKHKSIVKPGLHVGDTILFDQSPIYIECLLSKKIFIQNKQHNLKKNTNLKNILNFDRLYIEFNIKDNSKNKNIFIKLIKSQKLKNFVFSKFFFTTLNKLFLNSSTLFFKKNLKILLTLFTTTKQSFVSESRYKKILLDRYIKKNTFQNIISLYEKKVYNYKKIYFIENLLKIKIQKKAQLYLQVKNSLIFQLKNSNGDKNQDSFPSFTRSSLTPKFFILIRKARPYIFIRPSYYKKLVAKQNRFNLDYSSSFSKTTNQIIKFSLLVNFNKQKLTPLFFICPTADFLIKPSLKYKKHKKSIFYKKIIIFTFRIIVKIPKNHPINTTKVQLIYKSFCNIVNPKITTLCLTDFYFTISFCRELPLVNFTSQNFTNKLNKSIPSTVLISSQNSTSNRIVQVSKIFSPYEGEMIKIKLNNTEIQTDSVFEDLLNEEEKNQKDFIETPTYLILTNEDQTTFSTASFFNDKLSLKEKFLGKSIHYGTKIHKNLVISKSGQIIQIEKSKITLRNAQTILFSSKGLLSVSQGDLIERNALVLRLFYQRLKTGDIVQGIPKIEQLFEARKTSEGEILTGSVHEELEWLFRFYKKKYDFYEAAKRSLEKIQQFIVHHVQKVYQSQGVTIAEKHLEIIVRQMTSKVQIIDGPDFIPGELVDLDWIQSAHIGIDNQQKREEKEQDEKQKKQKKQQIVVKWSLALDIKNTNNSLYYWKPRSWKQADIELMVNKMSALNIVQDYKKEEKYAVTLNLILDELVDLNFGKLIFLKDLNFTKLVNLNFGKIFNLDSSKLFDSGKLIDLEFGKLFNLNLSKPLEKNIDDTNQKTKYKPVILGITRKSLETKSFISEASFQETTRILARSAVERKTDFLKGLKENVILGHVIPAGTGFKTQLDGKVFDSNQPAYFPIFRYESYTVFNKIFLKSNIKNSIIKES